MIQTIARQVIRKEHIAEYQQLAAELTRQSAKETGCVSYVSVQSVDDPRVHLFIECWKDQNAIDFHCSTTHFTTIVPQFADLFDEAETVTRYEVLASSF